VSAGIIGAIIGGVITFVAAALLFHPKTKGQRLTLLGLIVAMASLGPTIGALFDSDRQMRASEKSERDAKTRAQSARDEMLRQFGITRDQMTAAVQKIILDIHRLPPGERRTQAIQSALLDYDRAAARLAPASSTGVAALLPLAVEKPPNPSVAERESHPIEQPARKAAAPDAGSSTTTASTVPAVVGGTQVPTPVVTPVFIPPPPVVMMPPPPVMVPH
jgi:hypothetical protein